MYSLGYDIGSSSVKAALVDLNSKRSICVETFPDSELEIIALEEGWAEQDPDVWWRCLCEVTQKVIEHTAIDLAGIKSIGISYQMHGLVLVDKDNNTLRPSIIWCDSRAVEIGNRALTNLGQEYCLDHLLNSPGNFTASKLKWVQENEPQIYNQVAKMMLPGDYIAMKLTGEVATTASGLSEGIMWDFKKDELATPLLEYYCIDRHLIPQIKETFSFQGVINAKGASETGLPMGIPVTYRAGDQPNNAMSLGVLHPGEIAATGGTSGVVYGVSDTVSSDEHSRVNGFAHVNHSSNQTRVGQLLCINGAGSLYAWIRKHISLPKLSYTDMEMKLDSIPVGSDGLRIYPFGNGAERMLQNRESGAQFSNIQFNIHGRSHFYRAALEGIAFSFVYGIQILKQIGVQSNTIRVGNDNLFQSRVFATTIANLLNCKIEVFDTTGAVGAALASGVAIGHFQSIDEAVAIQNPIKSYIGESNSPEYSLSYEDWKTELDKFIN